MFLLDGYPPKYCQVVFGCCEHGWVKVGGCIDVRMRSACGSEEDGGGGTRWRSAAWLELAADYYPLTLADPPTPPMISLRGVYTTYPPFMRKITNMLLGYLTWELFVLHYKP